MELIENGIIDNIVNTIEKEIKKGGTLLIRIKTKEEIDLIEEEIKKKNKLYIVPYKDNIYKYEDKTILSPKICIDKEEKEKINIHYGDCDLREGDYGDEPYYYYKVNIDNKKLVEISRQEFWEM